MKEQPAIERRASIADRLATLVLALSVSGYALVAPIAVALGINSRIVSVPYRAIVVTSSLAALVAIYRSPTRRYTGLFWLAFGAFWLLYALRIAADTIFLPTTLRLKGWEYALYAFGICFIPAVACLGGTSERARAELPRLLLLVSFAACVAAVGVNIQAIQRGTFAVSLLSGRFALETLNPITFGEIGAVTSIVSGWWMLRAHGRLRALLVVPFAFGLACTALAGSRGPIVGLAVALLAILFAASRTGAMSRTRALVSLAVAITVFVIGGLWIEQQLGFRALSRFGSFAGAEIDESGDLRRQFLRGALHAYWSHPLLGASLDEPVSGEYPHNLVVESFMAIGTLGGVLFLSMLLSSLRDAATLLKREPTAQLVVALFLQQCISAMLSGSLYLSAGFWCTMTAVVASTGSVARQTIDRGNS